MNTLVVAIHGIMTGQTDPSWPDRLDAWLSDANTRVLKKEYAAGPFPRWNCLVKNRRLAAGLANEIRLILESRKAPEANSPAVWFVAHSNGALIALAAARTMIAEGRDVAGCILIGAACDSDVRKTGVLDWILSGRLGMAIAYCSPEDRALPGKGARGGRLLSMIYSALTWPYGSLGRTGWTLDGGRTPRYMSGALIGERIVTRWFAGGHSGCLAPERIEHTFRQIKGDMQGRERGHPDSTLFINTAASARCGASRATGKTVSTVCPLPREAVETARPAFGPATPS
jgi:pimeloyl-ACP methyl ester carboxylesterase